MLIKEKSSGPLTGSEWNRMTAPPDVYSVNFRPSGTQARQPSAACVPRLGVAVGMARCRHQRSALSTRPPLGK